MSQLCHHNTSNLNKRNNSYEFKNSCKINHQKKHFRWAVYKTRPGPRFGPAFTYIKPGPGQFFFSQKKLIKYGHRFRPGPVK
jgi:hypothetical protein